jgi:hypothetical protein
MIPQERRIEGLRIYFIFLISIFFLMENNNYVRFLGEGQEVLDSQEFINLSLVYWGGFFMVFHSLFSLPFSFSFSFYCHSIHLFMHSFTHLFIVHSSCGDCTQFIPSLIHLSSSMYWLEKGRRIAEVKPWYYWL